MPKAFTVDRARSLAPQQTLDLVQHTDLQPLELQSHVDDLFPDGVSQHGDNWFLTNSSLPNVAPSPAIELIFEYIRRWAFPERPSRFQSVFGCADLAEAQTFRADPRWRNQLDPNWQDAPIYEIEFEPEAFRADMIALTMQHSNLATSFGAHRYWRGETNVSQLAPQGQRDAPLWELLISPPVQVLTQVA